MSGIAVDHPRLDFRVPEIVRTAELTVRLVGRLMAVSGGAAVAADRPLSLQAQPPDGRPQQI